MATIKTIKLRSISKPCDNCAEHIREALGGGLGGAGAILAMLGFILLAGIDTLGIALVYELIPQAAREAALILALSAIANVSLLTGLLLLAVELLRTGALPRFVGILFGLAVLAFVPGYFGVALGGTLGAVFLGAGFVGAAPQLWTRS